MKIAAPPASDLTVEVDGDEALVLAAARVDDPRRFVDQALAGPLDWTRAVELTLAHHMAPALLRALDAASPDLVPRDVLEALQTYCGRLADQNDRLVVELFEILDALEARGVAAVPFKGPALAAAIFGAAAARTPGDLDLLVRPDDLSSVREVLTGRGYVDADVKPGAAGLTAAQRAMYEQYQCEYLFIRPADDMMVEPHWDLCQRPLALDIDYRGMLERTTTGHLAGRPVRQLAPDDLLLALCVHGAKHQWEKLAWVRDVAGVLAAYPAIDFSGLIDRATAGGYARLLLLSLEVVRRVTGAALKAEVAAAIEADPEVEPLVRQVLNGLFEPRPEPRNDRIEPFRYQMRERRWDRFRYALLTWVTPRRRHLELASLPHLLSWGYFPLKIGIDYAIAPVYRVIRGFNGDEVIFRQD